MKPGSTHLPAASTTSALSGTAKPGPSTATIFPASSRTVPPSMGSPSTGTTRAPTIALLIPATCPTLASAADSTVGWYGRFGCSVDSQFLRGDVDGRTDGRDHREEVGSRTGALMSVPGAGQP